MCVPSHRNSVCDFLVGVIFQYRYACFCKVHTIRVRITWRWRWRTSSWIWESILKPVDFIWFGPENYSRYLFITTDWAIRIMCMHRRHRNNLLWTWMKCLPRGSALTGIWFKHGIIVSVVTHDSHSISVLLLACNYSLIYLNCLILKWMHRLAIEFSRVSLWANNRKSLLNHLT